MIFHHSPRLQSHFSQYSYEKLSPIYRAKVKNNKVFKIFCQTFDIERAEKEVIISESAQDLTGNWYYYSYSKHNHMNMIEYGRVYFQSPDEQSLITKLTSIESLFLL